MLYKGFRMEKERKIKILGKLYWKLKDIELTIDNFSWNEELISVNTENLFYEFYKSLMIDLGYETKEEE